MKRLISLVLVCLMVFTMAACGNSGNGDNTPADTTGSESNGAADANDSSDDDNADDGEIWECVMPWPSLGDTPEGLEDIEAAINEITIPAIGVKVTINPIYCFDLSSQQTLMISSGDKLDLALIMLETNASYVNNGSIIDLTDLYAAYGTNINAALGEAVEACAINQVLYSIPVGETLGQNYGYLMRSDLLEKYGFSSENHTVTLDEFEEILAAIKEGEGPTFYPIAGLNDYTTFFRFDELGASEASGVLLLDKDTEQIVNLFATEEFEAFAKRSYEWTQKGYISPDASSTDGATDLVKAGSSAGQASSVNPGQDQWAANNAGYDMTILEVIAPYSKTNSLSNISWGITANCDNPEKAMQLIDLMYADNAFGTIMSAGLEGQSYEVVETDGTNMIIQYPDGLDSQTIPYYNMFGVWPNNHSQFAPLTLDYFDEIKAFNASMEYSPAFGYTFDASEYSTNIAAIESVIAQYNDAMKGGKVNPDDQLETFKKALEDAGINEVIEANQAQYDAWRAGQ